MQKRRAVLRPRKRPRQLRAQVTVDAILEAAAYILTNEGWDRFTTNRVADRAGVNIASLYQYFPNKLSILSALHDRHVARADTGAAASFREPARSLHELLCGIVDASIREHRSAAALHRVFEEELPRSVRRRVSGDSSRHQTWTHLLMPFITKPRDRRVVLFVARVAGHAVIHEALADDPSLLGSPAFADEVVRLLERYLGSPVKGRASLAPKAP
jgi:AcrR family transcriptional regulator